MENVFFSRDEIQIQLNSAIEFLDARNIMEIEMAKQLLDIKYAALSLEKERLIEKYGNEYAGVQNIEAELIYHVEMSKALEAQIDYSKIKTDVFVKGSWRVHGLVSDTEGNKLKDVKVSLTEDNKQPFSDIPDVYTNEQGFYAITLSQVLVKKYTGHNFSLTAFSKDKKKSSKETELLTCSAGFIDYRDIYIY